MAFRFSTGVTAPLICPVLSTAMDLRRLNSKPRPMMFPVLTTSGVARLSVTLEVVSVTAGLLVAFSLVMVGRVNGVVCWPGTFR